MTRNRALLALLALPLAAVLAGCSVGTPAPGPSAPGGEAVPAPTSAPEPTPTPTPTATPTPSPTPTPTPTPTDPAAEEPAPVVLATSIVIDSWLVAAYAVDGTRIAEVGFDETDHADAARRLAIALGLEPVVTSTGAIGTGCDADQTVYDFGGFLVRSPGYADSLGVLEVEVDGATTTNGIPVVTVGGAQIGMTLVEFTAAVGTVTELGSYSGRTWVGFDRINPAADAADAIGSLARFDDGVLAEWDAPVAFHGVC